MTNEVLTEATSAPGAAVIEQPPAKPNAPTSAAGTAGTAGTAVAIYGDDHQRALEMRALRLALPGLRDASDAQVMALLIAGKQTGYSQLRGEIYLTDRGIQIASKVLAAEAIEAAAQRGDTLTIAFEPIHEGMTDERALHKLEPGDVAVLVRITSSKARQAHYSERLARINELRAIGYERDEIEQKLREEFPHPPVIESMGVVKKSEDFGKRDAFPRVERASKRGLKAALSKGGYMTPKSRLPEIATGDFDDEPPTVTVIEPQSPALSPSDDERHAMNVRKLGRRDLDATLV